ISENRLPGGSTIQFRELTLWQRYQRQAIAIAALIAALSILIVTLSVYQFKRRRAARLLQESETRFRLFADTAPVLIWISGPDRRRTDFNRPWLEFTGRSLTMERDTGWAESVHPADREACFACLNALESHQAFEVEYRLRRADGEYRWIHD